MIDNFKQKYCRILGLTENELDFYLTLVKIGKSSVQKAAREMGIFRSSAYLLTESLVEKGLISQEFKKRGRYLVPEQPKVLLRLVSEKQKETVKLKSDLEKQIPHLLNLYKSSTKDPIIKVYEGTEGLKAIHEDILETNKTLYCYPRLDVAVNVLPFDFQMTFVNERIKKRIKVKALLPKNSENNSILKKLNRGAADSIREVRRLPDHLKDIITSEKMFYGDKVVYMTYGKKITGILIEHEEIAELEKKHFNIIWQISLPYRI